MTFLQAIEAIVLGLLAIAFAAFLFIGIIWMPGSRFPRWLFGLAFAWWWPHRPDSEASMLCDLVDCMTDEQVDKEWEPSTHNGRWHYYFPRMKMHISARWNDGSMDLLYKERYVPICKMDDYRLAKLDERISRIKSGIANKKYAVERVQRIREAALEAKQACVDLSKTHG